MKCLIFRGRTLKEATELAKKKLGKEALIISTRMVSKSKLWGLIGRDLFEVVAASEGLTKHEKQNNTFYMPGSLVRNTGGVRDSSYESVGRSVSNYGQQTLMPVSLQEQIKPREDALEPLQKEINELKRTLNERFNQLIGAMPKEDKYPPVIKEILERANIEKSIAEKILEGVSQEKFKTAVSPEIIQNLLVEQLVNVLQKPSGIIPNAGSCKLVALVGPTGMGKTTTIAKLAANFSMREGYRVGLITTDTYRVAAIEQLQRYAEIMDAPLEVVHTPEEMRSAVYRQRDKNIVFIDTAGSSPRNSRQLAETQSILLTIPTVEVCLVLSATTSYKDAMDIIERFLIFSFERIFFTKLDETDKLGLIVNVLEKHPGMLSYITSGQEVPSDIELANVRKLAHQILR